tara:strand:- start:2305 stop:3153 length:849 start_codon:yes stop_codon:yes gene_type:complete
MTTYKTLTQIIKDNNLSDKIIINDSQAWINYPNYQFIYNKLWIAQSQFINCAPMNVYPEKYPVFFKPIINLIGMSRGVKKINNKNEYDKYLKDGFFWEEFLEGNQYCIDLVLKNGNILFYSCLLSKAGDNGSFLYHESIPNYQLPDHIRYWINNFLSDYTGCLNIEVINGIIIEAHLRLNGDFHLYDVEFVKLLSNLYENINVNFNKLEIKKIFLIPIFVNKNYKIKSKESYYEILDKFKISHIFFNEILSLYQSEYLSRLMIFSCENLQDGLNAKKEILKI